MKKPWGGKAAETPRRRQLSQERQAAAHQDNQGLFRRNRTIVGSSSATVSSASELSADLQSPRVHAHHLAAHRRRLGIILTIVVAATCVLLWLLYEFTAGVHVSSTQNSVALQSERYQMAFNSYFSAHPIERLRFVTNQDQLTAYMQHATPEVKSVQQVGSAGFASSQFDITFRQPIASWLIGSTQYYVDNEGVSFQVDYFDQPSVKIVDQSGIPQEAGTAVASTRFLQFIGRSVAQAKLYNLVVEQAIIPPDTTREVELKVVGHSYPVKLSLDRPVGEQVEDMKNAIAYFDSKAQSPQYIDVRVSGKAFYQ